MWFQIFLEITFHAYICLMDKLFCQWDIWAIYIYVLKPIQKVWIVLCEWFFLDCLSKGDLRYNIHMRVFHQYQKSDIFKKIIYRKLWKIMSNITKFTWYILLRGYLVIFYFRWWKLSRGGILLWKFSEEIISLNSSDFRIHWC